MRTLVHVLLSLLFVPVIVVGFDQGQAFAAASNSPDCSTVVDQGVLCDGPSIASTGVAGASANRDTDGQLICPYVLSDGLLCTGPTAETMLTAGEERPCPLPIGEGVVCTGPDIPTTETDNENIPVEGNDADNTVQTPGLFLPFVMG